MKKNDNWLKKRVIESALIQGFINSSDLSNEKLLKKKLDKYLPKNDDDLYFIVLHLDDLLKKGKFFYNLKEYEYSYVFYAMYFEHFINEIIDIWATNSKIDKKISDKFIKKLNIEDKFTWVLLFLKLPQFNNKYFTIINKIAKKRNDFIHYKYPIISSKSSIHEEKVEFEKNLIEIKKSVKYTKIYKNKIMLMIKRDNLVIF